MNLLVEAMLPELILVGAACVLFLLGVSAKAASRRVAPVVAILALVVVFAMQVMQQSTGATLADPYGTFRVFEFAHFIKLLAAGVGVLLVLLAWPSNADATGNAALDFGHDAGEFFALMLLSLAGLSLVAGANDMVLLFLGIELASIPTYIMVSVSRPIPVAQEAGVKYFFLGAMAAAIMLFGFSYLYGTTGMTSLADITRALYAASVPAGGSAMEAGPIVLSAWQKLAVLMLVAGFSFKMAAVPLHFYAGDVYQGAATPVTAFLSFVPKATGVVAMVKLLNVVGATTVGVPTFVLHLLWVLAVLTMTVGNVLGLLQNNVKRVLAYSSIAHSGYILVGLTALCAMRRDGAGGGDVSPADALQGVLFYLAAYGIMNAAAFGVLMLLPARPVRTFGFAADGGAQAGEYVPPATTAETFDDLAGQGRRHVGLGLAMAVACFSLIGIPLTVGFFGKLYLIKPALDVGTSLMNWLVVITMLNAAISAGYYLRIVAAMFLRPEPSDEPFGAPAATESTATIPSGDVPAGTRLAAPLPITLAVWLSVAGTLLFGAVVPATNLLSVETRTAASLEGTTLLPGGSDFEDDAADDEDAGETPAEGEPTAAAAPAAHRMTPERPTRSASAN